MGRERDFRPARAEPAAGVQAVQAGSSVHGAVVTATTGTSGALLGSRLTSVAAFLALLLTPVALLQDFGVLATLALGSSRSGRGTRPTR